MKVFWLCFWFWLFPAKLWKDKAADFLELWLIFLIHLEDYSIQDLEMMEHKVHKLRERIHFSQMIVAGIPIKERENCAFRTESCVKIVSTNNNRQYYA